MTDTKAMTLRRKTLFIVLATLGALIAVLSLVSSSVVMRGFRDLEKDTARESVGQALAMLGNEAQELDVLADDWASWDDTYSFMAERDEQYVRSNLIPDTFQSLDISAMVLLHRTREVVFARGYDPTTGGFGPMPPGLMGAILKGSSSAVDPQIPEARAGIVGLVDRTMLVASRPILTSEGRGPSRGLLIMARELDTSLLAEISRLTRLEVTVQRVDGGSLSRGSLAAVEDAEDGFALRRSRHTLTGYTVMKDLLGDPVLLVAASQPRSVMEQGQTSQQYLLLYLIIAAVVFGLATVLLLERGVLARLRRLGREVAQVEAAEHPGARVRMPGRDELTQLSDGINEMLDALEGSRSRLNESEARYRAVVEQASEGILLVDPESKRVVEANRAYREMLGYTPEELAELTLYALVDVNPSTIDEAVDRVLDGGEIVVVERRHRRKDGTRIEMESSIGSVAYRGERMIVSANRDITAQKAAREVLRRREAILQAVGYAAERFLRSASWRDGIEETLGHLGEATSASRVSVFENETVDGDLCRTQRYEWAAPGIEPQLHNPATRRASYRGLGVERWAERMGDGEPVIGPVARMPEAERALLEAQDVRSVVMVPVFAAGRWWGLLGFDECRYDREWSSSEVGALRAAAELLGAAIEREITGEQLSKTEEQYRGIFENAVEGIFQTTPDGTILVVNPALARMFGFATPEEFIAAQTGASSIYVDPSAREEFLRLMEERGFVADFEYQARRRDGSTFWISENARVVRDEREGTVLYEGTVLDVTERKRAEESLRDAYRRERDAVERLRTLDEMKNAFLTAVSHELRTPLSSILGFALTLARRDLEFPAEQVREMVGRIAANASKLERLLADLLDLDRIARGILEPVRRDTDIGALARRIVDETELEGRPLLVEADDVMANVDASKVERILENLLANAVKYTPPRTPIWVRVTADEDGVLLVVEDAGPGVPSAARHTIFEPFRQGDDVPTHAPGTGIGLSLVARFAELHGGRAWVEERPGGGASFRVSLPGAEKASGNGPINGHRAREAVRGVRPDVPGSGS